MARPMQQWLGLFSFFAAFDVIAMPVEIEHGWPVIFPTQPEALGFDSHFIPLPQATLHAINRPGSDASLPPFVFIHGWPDSWRSFQLVLPLLGSKRRIIAVDLRGFGSSSKSAVTDADYSIDMHTKDVKGILDKLGVKEVGCLIGHSMGSMIARRFASRWPARVLKLMLIGNAPSIGTKPIIRNIQDQVVSLTTPDAYNWAEAFQTSTFVNRSAAAKWFVETVIREAIEVPLPVLRKTMHGYVAVTPEDAKNEMARITAPIMLVRGYEDNLATHKDNTKLSEMAHGVALVEVANAGHSVHWERHGAQTVADLIVNWRPSDHDDDDDSALPPEAIAIVIAVCIVVVFAFATVFYSVSLCRRRKMGGLDQGSELHDVSQLY